MLCGWLFLAGSGPASAAQEVSLFVYAAYGTPETVTVHGRVLLRKGRKRPKAGDSVWSNLWRMAGDLESDEVPGLPLVLKAGAAEARAITDEEGLFEVAVRAPAEGPFDPNAPPKLEIRIADPKKEFRGPPTRATPAILPRGATLILTDIDDTVVRSEVTDRSKLLFGIFTRNALQLSPIPGVAELYRRLSQAAKPPIPVFYLSGSPINFFQRLVDFLEYQEFPFGPMFLKDFGPTSADSLSDQQGYKLRRLRFLAERLPETRFLLFGDSGEQDAQIYTTFRKEHPGRAVAIFIRRVESTPKADKVLEGVVRTEDTFDAARTLVRLGFLSLADAEAVGQAFWGKNRIPEALVRDLLDAAREASGKGAVSPSAK